MKAFVPNQMFASTAARLSLRLRLMGNVVFLAGCQASEMKLGVTKVAMEDLCERTLVSRVLCFHGDVISPLHAMNLTHISRLRAAAAALIS